MSKTIVGIDLGTTNSAVAYIRQGRPEIIPSGSGERIIPSVVHLSIKGEIIVGENAKSALVAMPDRTVAAVKRKMGSSETIPLGEHSFRPEEISAMILKELKEHVQRELGEDKIEAVITVPAYFTDAQRKATRDAGVLAGFHVERIINEPTAAAMAFGLDHMEENSHILVYDLGGGTFDVSIVEMIEGLLEVKSSAGNNQLGGEDLDWRMVDWFAEEMKARHAIDPRDEARTRSMVKEEAERIKKQLSSHERVQVDLPFLGIKDGKPVGISMEVTRGQFEDRVADLLKDTEQAIDQALKDAKLSPQDIDDVLLVGGSTRIPYVREMVEKKFGKKPRTDVHPDEAVVMGAAIQAGLKSGELRNSGLVVTDVAPFSLGVAVLKEWAGVMRPGGFAPIITRNATIPITKTKTFSTSADLQEAVQVEVYQGEDEWCHHNYFLGEFLLEGVPAKPAGQETVDVTFHYDLNGILEVKAKLNSTEKEMGIQVKDALDRMSSEALEESMNRLEELWLTESEDNLDNLDNLDLENDWQELLLRAEEKLEAASDFDKKKLKRLMERLSDALETGDEQKIEMESDKLMDLLIDMEL